MPCLPKPDCCNSKCVCWDAFLDMKMMYQILPSLYSGREAAGLEADLGIHVLRHKDKKPAGGAAELSAHFGCPTANLVMVGDR